MNEIIITTPDELERRIQEAFKRAVLELKVIHSDDSGKKVYSNRQAMKYLSVSRSTLQRWRQEGRLPFRKVSGKILYTQGDLDRLLEEAQK